MSAVSFVNISRNIGGLGLEESVKVNPLATEKIERLILKFSIPAIISMLVSSLYNIVDQIFIGQGVGLLGNAATNIAFPITIICTATALLLGPSVRAVLNVQSASFAAFGSSSAFQRRTFAISMYQSQSSSHRKS